MPLPFSLPPAPLNDLSEETLVALIQRDARSPAAEELFRRLAPWVGRRVARNRLGTHDAEDVTQEALLIAFEAILDFDRSRDCTFRTCVEVRVVRRSRTAAGKIRRRRDRECAWDFASETDGPSQDGEGPAPVSAPSADWLADEAADPARRAESEELMADLERLLEQRGARDRLVAEAVYAGVPFGALAAEWGTTVEAVRQRWQRLSCWLAPRLKGHRP